MSVPDDSIWVNQDAWFWLQDFKAGQSGSYTVKRTGNGVYFLVFEGAISIANELLERRDGLGIEDVSRIELTATADCQLLVMDVPMQS